jgi:uncharacterized protein
MKISEMFRKCKVEAYDILYYFKSPYLLWCNYHAPGTEKDEESDYMKMLAERGINHEVAFKQQAYPGMKLIPLETTEEILKEMRKGVDAFDNLPIFDPKMMFAGKPDIMEIYRNVPSKLGNFHYIVKEVKSVREPRMYHIMQAAFYNYIIGLMQGYTPKTFYIVNKLGEEIAFNYQDYEENLLLAVKDIQDIKGGKNVTPTLDMPYPWTNYSLKMALETRDVSLVNGISVAMKPRLNEVGIQTVDDLHVAKLDSLLCIRGVGEKNALSFKRSAQALIQGKPIIFGKPNFPKKKTEIFFDLEATMPDEELDVASQINYLFGMIIRRKGKESYIPIVAKTLEEEGKIFKKFLKTVTESGDFVIYYYSNFEKAQLSRMFKEYGTSRKTIDMILTNSVDLQREVKNSVTFPTTKNGLKEIAGFLGFKWRHKDVNAQESMAWFIDYIKNEDKEKLKKIIDYNEDDCRATMIIKDWMDKNLR